MLGQHQGPVLLHIDGLALAVVLHDLAATLHAGLPPINRLRVAQATFAHHEAC